MAGADDQGAFICWQWHGSLLRILRSRRRLSCRLRARKTHCILSAVFGKTSIRTSDRSDSLRGDRHGEISLGQFQDLPLGAARSDRAAGEEGRFRVPAYRIRQSARLVPGHFSAQEGPGAAHRRADIAVRIQCDRRIFGRHDCAAAAPRRSGRARHQPRLDRLSADLRRIGDRDRLCRQRGRVRRGGGKDPGPLRAAREGAREAGQRPVSSTAPIIRWWMRATRRSCSAISSSTG